MLFFVGPKEISDFQSFTTRMSQTIKRCTKGLCVDIISPPPQNFVRSFGVELSAVHNFYLYIRSTLSINF